MNVLIDTSIWIEYFKTGEVAHVDFLIDENLVVTNELILTELIPYLKLKKQTRVITLFKEINLVPLKIDWDEIIEYQFKCLKNGANGIGIPDLIIAQNAKQNNLGVYSLDKHFRLMGQNLKLKLYS